MKAAFQDQKSNQIGTFTLFYSDCRFMRVGCDGCGKRFNASQNANSLHVPWAGHVRWLIVCPGCGVTESPDGGNQ